MTREHIREIVINEVCSCLNFGQDVQAEMSEETIFPPEYLDGTLPGVMVLIGMKLRLEFPWKSPVASQLLLIDDKQISLLRTIGDIVNLFFQVVSVGRTVSCNES